MLQINFTMNLVNQTNYKELQIYKELALIRALH